MRVRCIKILGTSAPHLGTTLDASPHLAVGDEYFVLAILVDTDSEAPLPHLLCILDRDSSPTWWPIAMFMTVSSEIPSNWVVEVRANGSLHFSPVSWLRHGFWEEYSDNPVSSTAAEQFRREVDVIVRAG
jgi:hypothetical protein